MSHIFWLFHKLRLDLETDMNSAYFYKVEEMRMRVEEIGREEMRLGMEEDGRDEDGVGDKGGRWGNRWDEWLAHN